MRNTNTFGWRVGEERRRLDIGQKELAEMIQEKFGINIGQSVISKIENDQTQTPPFPVQIALSKILRCSLNYLIAGEEWTESTDHFATDEANRIGAMVDAMSQDNRQLMIVVAERLLSADVQQNNSDVRIAELLQENIRLLSNGQRSVADAHIQRTDQNRRRLRLYQSNQ